MWLDQFMTPQDIFNQHVRAGMLADAEAKTALYTPTGIYEAPLAHENGPYPHRLEGHNALHTGFTTIHDLAKHSTRQIDPTNSRLTLHTTTDPDIFIVELDAAFTNAPPVPLVQIYRLHEGKIAHLRDYFAPDTTL